MWELGLSMAGMAAEMGGSFCSEEEEEEEEEEAGAYSTPTS